MKLLLATCFLSAFALAVPPKYSFDHKVLITFGLVSTQNNGGNPNDLLKGVLPHLQTDNVVLDRTTQLMLLASGGLNLEKSRKLLDETLPKMAREGKSSHELLMALMVASKQFCKGEICGNEESALVPIVTAKSERGCRKHFVHTNIEISGNDKCVCDKQDSVLLWLSTLDVISGYGKQGINGNYIRAKIPDQIPVILMMLMQQPCNGTIKGTQYKCQCSAVNEGNEDVLLQYLINTPGVEDILTTSAKAKARHLMNEPGIRALDLSSALLTQTNINPTLLSLFTNSGSDPQDIIKQMVMSGLGLDVTTTQLVLNGGFGSDNNKVAMINYLANMGLMSVNAIPLLLGVDNGVEFFINSLLSQGAIDPTIGALMLGQQSGASQSDILEFLTDAMLSRNDPDYFKYLTEPFIPTLPSGIYPGMQLYFLHFETLGINTCALHDLRNRFECGFTGITAAQCEILPYCCYNPVFLTDSEVVNMTAGAISSALDIPWCYYNVFFIYYDSFFLTVKKPGQFASPFSCLPLFKYGLNIDASSYYLYGQNSGGGLSGLTNPRSECGFPGITEFHCVAIRGCCWDAYAPYGVPQCYNPNGYSSFDYNLNAIPVAYQPMNGTCNTNYRGLRDYDYTRITCSASLAMILEGGRDPLKPPGKYECLWQLGCCWDEEYRNPKLPRCYKREDGTYTSRPNAIGQLSSLVARSGNGGIIDKNLFPPKSKEE